MLNTHRKLIAIPLLLAGVITGCSSTNPYQRSQYVDKPIDELGSLARHDGAGLLAGNLHGALLVLKDQRLEWYESLSAQARVRSVTQLGLLGLSAVTLYTGLKSGGVGEGDKKRLALVGAAGLAAYGASTWFVNPGQELAYVEGITALTCAMLTIEPFRFDAVSFSAMRVKQDELSTAIDNLDARLGKDEATIRYSYDSQLPQALVRREARTALVLGRKTLASSEHLRREIDNSGVTLMREGDLIFARIAAKINGANKEVGTPASMASGAAAIVGKFQAVKIDVDSESARHGASDSGTTEPGKTSEIQATPSGSEKSRDATNGENSKPLSSASTKELAAQLEIRQQKDLQNQATRHVSELRKAREEAKNALANARLPGAAPADSVAIDLASKTADLYKARRPLSNRLLTFYQARKVTEKNKSCVGAASPMTVSPSDDANVAQGAAYPITISGVVSPPSVTIKGNATHDYQVGPGANQYTYIVRVTTEAKGFIDIAISDRGLAMEDIRLTVVPAKAPP